MKKLLIIVIICAGFYKLLYSAEGEAVLPLTQALSCEFSKEDIIQYELTRLNNHVSSWSFFSRVESMINIGYLKLDNVNVIKKLEENFQNHTNTVERAYILWTLSKIDPQNKLIGQNQQKFYDRAITQYHKNNMMFLASHIAFLSSSNAASSPSQKQQMHSIIKTKIDEWLGFHNHKNTNEKAYAIFALHEIGTPESLALKNELLNYIYNLYDTENTKLKEPYESLGDAGYAANPSISYLLGIKEQESSLFHDDILETLLKINPYDPTVIEEFKEYINKNINSLNKKLELNPNKKISLKKGGNYRIKKSISNLKQLQPYSNCAIGEIEKILNVENVTNDILLEAANFIVSSPRKLNTIDIKKISNIQENSRVENERKHATSILEINNSLPQ